MQIFDIKQMALLSLRMRAIYPQNINNLSIFEKILL